MKTALLLHDLGLIDEILALLEANDRLVPLERIGKEIFRLQNPHSGYFRHVVNLLIKNDPRFLLRSDGQLELLPTESEQSLLRESDFVVVDVETTGIDPGTDRITEIAAFKILRRRSEESGQLPRNDRLYGNGHAWMWCGGKRDPSSEGEFVTLLNPQREIPASITRLTGITNEMVAKSPRFAEIVDDLLAFIGDSVIVGHNAHFDINFLNQELKRVFDKRLGNPRLCTLQLCRRLFPDFPNYKLQTVAREMGVEHTGKHRAWGDALATAGIFIRVLEALEERGALTVLDARRLHGRQTRAQYAD